MNNLFSTKNIYRSKEEELLNEEGIEKAKVLGVVVRVSTEMQVVDGDSIEMQQEAAQKYAEEIGGVIHKFYIEEGLSASKTRIKDREKIQELMKDIEDGVVNHVVSYKRDRLFRNTTEHMQFLQFLVEHDCEVYFTARGELQVDLSQFKASGMGKMMESLLSMWAEMEAAQTSTRVSDTMISKASKGEFTGGRLPVGYKREGGKFVPIKEGLEVIKLIEDLYISGHGVKTIARYLNGNNVKGLGQLEYPIPKPSVYAKSETWSQRTVQTVLFSPFYTGHLSYNSKKNADIDRIIAKSDLIQPIRTIETQEELFEIYKKKKQPNKPTRAYSTPFLLTGIVYCGECGEPIKTQTSQMKDGTRYSYYKCGKRHTVHKDRCSMNRIYRKELLEKMVLDVAKDKLQEISKMDTYELFRQKVEDDKKTISSQTETIEERIKTLKQTLENYAKMVVGLEGDEELKEIYLAGQRKALKEINELKTTQASLIHKFNKENEENEAYEKFLELADNFQSIIETASIGLQKQLLENLFESIHVNKEGEIDMAFNFGSNNIFDKMRDSKVPSFISLDTIRDGMDSKDIKTRSFISLDTIRGGTGSKGIETRTVGGIIDVSTFTPFYEQFNYVKSIEKLGGIIKSSYLPFLISLDRKLDVRNANLITESDIEEHPRYSPNLKLKGKWNCYVELKLNISKATRQRLEKGTVPHSKTMKVQVKNLGSTFKGFLKYIKKMHNLTHIDETMVNEIESVHGSHSTKKEYLFSGVIKCHKCGNNFTSKMWTNRKYLCVKQTYNKNAKCDSPFILDERFLISAFEELTNTNATRENVLKEINWIEVLPDGEIQFHLNK